MKETTLNETKIVPYGLQVLNTKYPTKVQSTSESLDDYIIGNHLQSNSFKTYISDQKQRHCPQSNISD